MEKYFVEIAYKGTSFSGWQRQNNAISIQEQFENAFSKLYNKEVSIVGCGRTDAGVHASQYYFHIELPNSSFEINDLIFKLNYMIGHDIVVRQFIPVHTEAHARFDATSRSYKYFVSFKKNPFTNGQVYEYSQSGIPDFNKLNEAAQLLLNFGSFFPFCKTNSDVENYDCKLTVSNWENLDNDMIQYNISSNRFLRGMVRLIVGMCLNVSVDKISLDEVQDALEKQTRLAKPWAAPAEGLFLWNIQYPYI